ncbi:Ig-like domain-containing protein [Vibrio pomeroyi]|uniref:Ig-like domain-containing protein n=1 Tax=Vibrio pomeroyi TaxID=198832 RepID=A0ABV4MRG4_9VIBR|nr:Ig-like domain-containing protein [Vibrio atlanticus]MCZ4310196.1 Ig-like domain-containing protein [Vibrio atlanticus]
MKQIRHSLPLLVASMCCMPSAMAEVLSLSYTDTNNEAKELAISTEFFNPNSDITLLVSGGLDRRLNVYLNDSIGITVQNKSTEVIGVNDRITSLSRDFYGKAIVLPKPVDGTYTLTAEIEDLSGRVVQTDSYSLVVDTTPPTLGDPLANSYGGLDGLDLPPDTWYTGYYSHNKYYVQDIDDAGSGILSVNAITRDKGAVYKHSKALYDAQSKQAHIGNGGSWFPRNDNATRVFNLQFEAIDKAGNKGYSKKQKLYFDSVAGSEEKYAVYDPDSNNVMGGQKGYVPYVAGMKVKTNPIQLMYRIPKSDYSDYARGGIYPVGASQTFKDVDDDYVYTVFIRPIGYTDGNYVRFTDRRAWITDYISYNLVLDDSATKAPVRKGNQYKYSDIGWSSWSRQVNVPDMPVQVMASKVFVEPRSYEQTYDHMGTCTIPAGDTECTITYDPPKAIDLGTHGNLHHGSTVKNPNGKLYGAPSWANVHWNNSQIPEIKDTEWNPETKRMTVYAHQPTRGYYFDSIRITDAFIENGSTRLSVPRTKWEENGANYKFEFDLSGLPEGNYQISAAVKENHQNYDRAHVVDFINDTTPPSINLTYKGAAIGDIIQGVSGLAVQATDATPITLLDAKLSGGPASDTVYLAYSQLSDGHYKLEQPRIFPALLDNEIYTLTVRMKDDFSNVGVATASFKYTPENWIKISDLRTLPVATKLLYRDDTPLALVTSSELRTDSGNLATGEQVAVVTLRDDAPYSIVIEGQIIAPGQSQSVTFDLGTTGGKLYIPINLGESHKLGNAEFMIEVPQLKSIYDN